MWNTLAHWLLGPAANAWLLSRIRHDGEMAFPTDPPLSHGSGPDPDRVLLIGGLVVGGAGVASFDLALGGRIARRLASRTGRGADVETRSIARYDTAAAAALLRAENLDRFDAVMIVLGVRQVMRLRPAWMWRRDVQSLLGVIAESVSAALPVMIVGIAPFARDMDVPRFAVHWLEAAVERRNAETRRLCEATGVAQFVPFAPTRTGIRSGLDASAVYESWAQALTPALDRALALAQPVPHLDEADEPARQRALDELGIVGAPADPRIDHIVQMTRGILGMSAAITLLDENRTHILAAAGIRLGELPREDTFCHLTVESPGALVVADAEADPGYRGVGRVEGREPVRFYAGYPLEAPGGQRIGALCVIDRVPREFSADETSLLRDLALRVQAVLWESAGVR